MSDMDNNMNLLLSAGISSAMFDEDPGDETHHPAHLLQPSQHDYNASIGPRSSSTIASVEESPEFSSLAADHITNSPPFLPLQAQDSAVSMGEMESASSTESMQSSLGPAAAAAASSAAPVASALLDTDFSPSGMPSRPRSDSESQRKTSALLREQWMIRYHELIEYKRREGHCNVPQREKRLGCWVSTQRTQYKLLLEGRQSQMNQERIDMLNALDFNWDPRGIFKRIRKESEAGEDLGLSPKRADRNDRKWMQWYNEMCRFKEEHGHCAVTRKADKSLGIWTQKQRKLYRERQAGKLSKALTPERIDLLNSIGFEWEVPPGSRPSVPKKQKTTQQPAPSQDEWHQRFLSLKKYKEEFGNCIVPGSEKEYADLFSWVSELRRGQDKLPHDLKHKLDEIGFEWDGLHRMDSAADEDWNRMFFELSQFKVINRHTNVAAWSTDPRACRLAEWCDQQRYHYEDIWADRYSPLTEDRIKQLNQLGFDWTLHQGHTDPTPDDTEWTSKLELMKEFKVANGHCNVPRNHVKLGAWADAQRLAMKNLLEGTPAPTIMTWDRFSQLEAIGFDLSVRASDPASTKSDNMKHASMQSQ